MSVSDRTGIIKRVLKCEGNKTEDLRIERFYGIISKNKVCVVAAAAVYESHEVWQLIKIFDKLLTVIASLTLEQFFAILLPSYSRLNGKLCDYYTKKRNLWKNGGSHWVAEDPIVNLGVGSFRVVF